MEYKYLQSFRDDYKKLPPQIQERVKKALELFEQNQRHPSLQTHPIRGTSNPKIFEGYISKSYRFTFHYGEDSIIFRRVGPHNVVDQESRS